MKVKKVNKKKWSENETKNGDEMEFNFWLRKDCVK